MRSSRGGAEAHPGPEPQAVPREITSLRTAPAGTRNGLERKRRDYVYRAPRASWALRAIAAAEAEHGQPPQFRPGRPFAAQDEVRHLSKRRRLVLEHLHRHGHQTAHECGARSDVLARMEEMGLVSREADSRWSITRRGRRALRGDSK